MKRICTLWVVLVLVCVGFWPQRARGQFVPQILVMHVDQQPKEDTFDLNVLFTVLDRNGQALPREAINIEAEGNAFGPTFPEAPARVEPATTPIRIALVIDASGSMEQEINDVRNAAINFVRKVPDNAQVAVYKFSDLPELVQGFTAKEQIASVENAILGVTNRAPGTGNTCIFQAASRAISDANAGIDATNVARPTVVLFTDGKDSEAGDCGPIKEQQVVAQAQQTGIPTQVHTIGLCNDDSCSNVNGDALNSLAKNTAAATKSGKLGDLDNLFNAILSALNSQFMARTSIKPQQGPNQVAIQFNKAAVNAVPATISINTQIESPRDYGTPPPSIRYETRTYNAQDNSYTETLSVTNPEQIDRITVRILDKGNTVKAEETATDIGPTTKITLSGDQLNPNAEFVTEITAVDKNGNIITDAEGKSPIVLKTGTHLPPAQAQLSFSFAGPPEFNWDTGEFVIKVAQVNRGDDTRLLYSGTIAEGNRKVMDIPLGELADSAAVVKLVDAELGQLRQANQGKTYTLNLTLTDQQTGDEVTQPVQATAIPPEAPGFFQRILLTVRNPIVLGSILIIVVMIAAVAIVLANRKARRDIPLPSPFNQATGMAQGGSRQPSAPSGPPRPPAPPIKPATPANAPVSRAPSVAGRPPLDSQPRQASAALVGQATQIGDGAAEPSQPEMLVTIVTTPEPALNQGRVARELPCVIGRENCPIVIAGDRKISRRHVEISVQGRNVMIKDLDSANGTALVVPEPAGQLATFAVKRQLERGASVEWDNSSLLRLGPNTVLRIMLPGWPPKDDDSSTVIEGEPDNRTQIAG